MKYQRISRKTKKHKWQVITQSLLGSIIVFLTLVALHWTEASLILRIVGSTSLAATTFLVFAAPRSNMAQSRNLILGYIIGILVGVILWQALTWCHSTEFMCTNLRYVLAAFALFCSITLMALFDAGHPPSAGLSVALVLEPWQVPTLVVILVVVVVLISLKTLLKSKMIDLV